MTHINIFYSMTISPFYFMSIVVKLYVPDKDLEDVL